MSNIVTQSRAARFISVLLITLLIVTAMPVNMWQVHADTATIATDKDAYVVGEPVKVSSTGYASGEWVAIYSANDTDEMIESKAVTSYFWHYPDGGSWNFFDYNSNNREGINKYLPAGDYRVLLIADTGSAYSIKAEKKITINRPAGNGVLSTDKESYDVGEAINVTIDCEPGSLDWVALFKKNEAPGAGPGSFTYYYPSEKGKVYNLTSSTSNEIGEGEWTVYFLADNGYTVIDYKDIIVKHQYGEWEFDEATKTHTRACVGHADITETKNCTFDAGVAVENGTKYTCSVCKGTFIETHHYEYTCNGDKTHSAKCTDEGCNATIEKEDCTLDAGKRDGDKAVFNCSVCKGESKVPLFVTDKTEYKWGDAINVTTNYVGSEKDWIGIYKKGETYDPNNGGAYSIYWDYVTKDGTLNLMSLADKNGRAGEFVAGEYTIAMFSNDSYSCIATADITVTKEETGRVTVDPTCNDEGYTEITYSDGTTEKVDKKDALGHAYPETWNYDGASKKTHTRVCGNDASHVESANCDFELTSTTEAKPGVKGEKLFTCTVCEGTYTEEIPALGVEPTGETEVIKAATCEDKGTLRVFYNDGSYIDEEIPALNHAYPENWTFDEATKTHSKVCGNDTTHVQSGNCEFTTVTGGGIVTCTCTVCGGTYVKPLLSTDKEVYNYGDYIWVTHQFEDYTKDSEWIGIYKKNEVPGTDKSIYWYYLSDQTTNLADITRSRGNGRDADYIGGEYTIYLFGSDSSILASVDITVNRVQVGDPVRTEPTCEADGSIVTNYNDGTTETETIKKLGHAYPDEWAYDGASKKTHSRVCGNDASHVESADCDFELTSTTEAKPGVKGEKLFTCKVCEGTYTEEIPALGVEPTGETEVIKAATCEEVGTLRVFYNDGSFIDEEIPVLGHKYPENWTFDEATKTHSKVCGNDATHVQSGNCEFTTVTGGGIVTETCTVCGGTVVTTILATDKTSYCDGEAIMVTHDYTTDGSTWIGLYKKGEQYDPNNGGSYSIFWYYLNEEEKTVDITKTRDENGRSGEFVAGEYKVVLFGDGNYSKVVATVDITVGCDYGEWKFDAESKTHSRVCEKNPAHVETKPCEFESTVDKDGTTFTCTVCGGSYVESHHYEYTYNNDKATHVKKCTDAGCTLEAVTEDCRFEQKIENGKVVYTCKDCGGSYTLAVITTDKQVYDLDEAINVTIDKEFDLGAKDWVGLYKKGEAPDSTESVISFYYDYPQAKGGTFNIWEATYNQTSDPRRGPVTPGEYTLYLCANDGYDVIASVDVTITHEFGDWTYDKETKTHSRVCDGVKAHKEGPTACTFEAKVTKEPTATETGIKTYTCTVCGGSYEEVLPTTAATLVDTKVIDATCEADGKKIETYSDGTVLETVIPALGHAYDEANAVFDEATKTHSVACKNDKTHIKSEDCNFETVSVKDGTVTHKCTVCGGTFESGLLYVEKDTYAASDNIDVIATCDAKDSWVGLYGIDEKADPNNGGVVSYYWYTVTGDGIDRSGKKITLTDFYNEERREGLTPGEYKIVLFGDGKYSNVLAEKQITITESKTTYEVKMKDKVVADGETVAYDSKDSIKVNVTSDGNPGQAWVGIYPGKYDKSHDFSTTTSTQWYKISEYNGKDFTVTSQDLKEDGIYTVAVFGDGAYSNIKHMSYYTVTEEGLTEEIIEQPTCTKPGVKKVLYEGDTEPTYVPIPALGHDIELVYDKDAKTHSGECTRCDYVADGEPCTFDEGVVTDNIKTYTCTKCGGQYTEEVEKPLPPYTEENGRVAGNDRFDTALEAAEQLKKTLEVEKFENIIIASGMDYADALSGTYLAKVKNAPILLINGKSDAVMKEVAEYAKANLKDEGTIYILGGEVAVPAKFNTYIDSENIKIARLAGKNRYETNLAILQEAGVEGKDVLVCTGTNFADSLSASASGKAILLVGSTLDTKQKEFLGGLKDKKYYILGGTVAISNTLEDSIRAFGGTERISGKDRFETSVKFAEKFFENPKAAVLTYGLNFPDGLAGGVLAMSMDAPLILTAANNDTFAKEYTKANNIVSGVVLGGTKLISEAAAMSIFNVAK